MIWPLIFLLLVTSGTRAKDWFWSRSKEQESALELSYKPGSEIAWVGTLSGELHALNTKTGAVLWSADIGGSTLRSFQALDSSDVGVVVPGVDGSVFVHTQGELKRFPLTVPDFVEKSPMFQVLPNGRKLTIVGSKIDRVFQLDADTGRIVRSFSSEPGDDISVNNEDEFITEPLGERMNLLMVNRQDYRVRAFDEESGKEVWNFTYGVIDPISAKPDAEPSSLLMDAHAKLLLDRVQTLWKHPSPIASATVTLENDALVIAKQSMLQRNAITEAPSNPSAIVKRMVLQDGAVQLYVSPSEPMPERKGVNKGNVESKAVAIVSDDSSLIPADIDDGTCAIALGSHKVVPFIPEALGSYPNVSRPSNSNNLNTPTQSFSPDALMLTWFTLASLALFALIVRLWRRASTSSDEKKSMNNTEMNIVSKESEESLAVSSHEDSSVQSVTTRSVAVVEQDANRDVSHRVGKLNVYMSKIKGYGGNGTIVVEGRFEERPVAIKRMQSALYDRASKEIDFLIQSEGHSNVVRYLAKEETHDFVYLALELCEMTLDQAIEQRLNDLGHGASPSSWISDENRLFLHELASATNHLHINGIVHCDIKPQNVLVVPRPNRSSGSVNSLDIGSKWMPKLSDMGLSRNVDVDQSSFRLKSHASTHDTKGHMIGGGTVGWRAPELLVRSKDKKSRLSRKVDVFSLGCVFFYILQDGGHPFGEWLQRESQIVEGDAVGMERLPASFAEPKHLIAEMIAFEPTKRPSMAACVSHPLLWNSKARLDFICDVSNRLEKVDPNSRALKDLESRSKKLFSPVSGWAVRLDATLEKDVNASKHRKYDVGSFRDLLRYIRNKRHHFDEDPELSRVLSWEPELFLEVFCKSYPDLVTQAFEWAVLHCGNEPKFVDLFGGTEVITERCERMPRLVQDEPILSASCKRQAGPTSREWFVDNWMDDFPDRPPIPMPPSFNHKSNLCAHWERSGGQFCVMGSKCGFAHGIIELRVIPETTTRPPPPTVFSIAQGRQNDNKKPPRVMMNHKTPVRKPTIPGFEAFE